MATEALQRKMAARAAKRKRKRWNSASISDTGAPANRSTLTILAGRRSMNYGGGFIPFPRWAATLMASGIDVIVAATAYNRQLSIPMRSARQINLDQWTICPLDYECIILPNYVFRVCISTLRSQPLIDNVRLSNYPLSDRTDYIELKSN